MPFTGNSTKEIHDDIINRDLNLNPNPNLEHVSDEAKDLLRKLLTKDPKQRVTAR